MSNNPLVSVCVITYNSSKYVLETLESIKNQTYQNIELVVSDDCSKDNTVTICRDWIVKNKRRFVKTELVESEMNTGIADNCNRGFRECRSDWIKFIAGDDVLLESCIENNVRYVQDNPQIRILFSQCEYFNGSKSMGVRPMESEIPFFSFSARQQLDELIKDNIIPCTPTAFFCRGIFDGNDYADVRFPFLEDYPLWIRLTKKNLKLWFMPKVTIRYRYEDSITRNSQMYINPLYFLSLKKFHEAVLFQLYSPSLYLLKLSKKIYFFKMKIILKYFNNKRSKKADLFIYLFKFIDPMIYKNRISKLLK